MSSANRSSSSGLLETSDWVLSDTCFLLLADSLPCQLPFNVQSMHHVKPANSIHATSTLPGPFDPYFHQLLGVLRFLTPILSSRAGLELFSFIININPDC